MERQTSTSSNGSFGLSRRRQADFVKLATCGRYQVVSTETVGDFYVYFQGPKDTPYEGGHWHVHVLLTEHYPYKSPSIGFANPIFHPNVEERSGSICLDVINQTWTPMYDLVNIFDIFLPQLLRYPNPADPLNPAAATMQLESLTRYGQYIQEHISKHATKERAMAVVSQFLDPEVATPSKQQISPTPQGEPSPATTFASRGLTDSPPSSLTDELPAALDDDDEEAPAEIDI